MHTETILQPGRAIPSPVIIHPAVFGLKNAPNHPIVRNSLSLLGVHFNRPFLAPQTKRAASHKSLRSPGCLHSLQEVDGL